MTNKYYTCTRKNNLDVKVDLVLNFILQSTIYVPGDNDIGGEGMDEVTPNKVSRFFSAFKQTEVDSFKFIDFIQV